MAYRTLGTQLFVGLPGMLANLSAHAQGLSIAGSVSLDDEPVLESKFVDRTAIEAAHTIDVGVVYYGDEADKLQVLRSMSGVRSLVVFPEPGSWIGGECLVPDVPLAADAAGVLQSAVGFVPSAVWSKGIAAGPFSAVAATLVADVAAGFVVVVCTSYSGAFTVSVGAKR